MAAEDDLPLSGLRVVALEHAVAAPLCSRHLADLGAEVIKLERPPHGDFARRYDSVVHGQSAYFVWLNRGKRSVMADLSGRPGRELLDGLLSSADVFVHNLGPGAVDRLGYGWGPVHERWPGLVWCAISGFGQEGPYRDHKAFDLLLQGESGLASVTGGPDAPARVGISIADIGAGMYALSAILAALLSRERTGEGARLDISMLDAMAEWMSVPALYRRYAGQQVPRTGLHHPTIAPYGPYQGADGPPILVAVQNDGQWRRFCTTVLSRPDLSGESRFRLNEDRVRNREALDREIATALAHLLHLELRRRLEAADVPHGPVNDLAALLDHPQLRERGRWLRTETPGGPVTTVAPPLGWPARPGRVPELGADTEQVQREARSARQGQGT